MTKYNGAITGAEQLMFYCEQVKNYQEEKMANTIFCNNCGRIIPDPDNKEVNDKYFCDEECEFEYVYEYSLYVIGD